ARAMEQSGKVGIARVVMRTKQYLCAVRPQDGKLVMSTMVYADEVNDPAQIPELAQLDDVEVSDKELVMAEQLIASLSETFDPAKYTDTYRTKVLEVIERKAAGEEDVIATPEPQEEKVVDLMAALEASVAAAKEARGRHPTAATPGTVSGEEIAGEDAPADEDAAQTA
ncbi:MAG TPA: Ku protein, partial [Acidimicrobiales bacterium]|nr:Ku protein [Acidimicrobiales bacterium]